MGTLWGTATAAGAAAAIRLYIRLRQGWRCLSLYGRGEDAMEMEEYENELQREETTEMGFEMEAETEMAGCGIVGGGRWEMEDRYVYSVANTFFLFLFLFFSPLLVALFRHWILLLLCVCLVIFGVAMDFLAVVTQSYLENMVSEQGEKVRDDGFLL